LPNFPCERESPLEILIRSRICARAFLSIDWHHLNFLTRHELFYEQRTSFRLLGLGIPDNSIAEDATFSLLVSCRGNSRARSFRRDKIRTKQKLSQHGRLFSESPRAILLPYLRLNLRCLKIDPKITALVVRKMTEKRNEKRRSAPAAHRRDSTRLLFPL